MMYNYHYKLKEYYKAVGKELIKIIEKVYTEELKEQIEFNGRWCDDGGRNIE